MPRTSRSPARPRDGPHTSPARTSAAPGCRTRPPRSRTGTPSSPAGPWRKPPSCPARARRWTAAPSATDSPRPPGARRPRPRTAGRHRSAPASRPAPQACARLPRTPSPGHRSRSAAQARKIRRVIHQMQIDKHPGCTAKNSQRDTATKRGKRRRADHRSGLRRRLPACVRAGHDVDGLHERLPPVAARPAGAVHHAAALPAGDQPVRGHRGRLRRAHPAARLVQGVPPGDRRRDRGRAARAAEHRGHRRVRGRDERPWPRWPSSGACRTTSTRT